VLVSAVGFHGRLERVEGSAVRTLEAERKSSARSVTAENYSGVGSFGETKAINRQPRYEADWATALHSAFGASHALIRHDSSEGGE